MTLLEYLKTLESPEDKFEFLRFLEAVTYPLIDGKTIETLDQHINDKNFMELNDRLVNIVSIVSLIANDPANFIDKIEAGKLREGVVTELLENIASAAIDAMDNVLMDSFAANDSIMRSLVMYISAAALMASSFEYLKAIAGRLKSEIANAKLVTPSSSQLN